MTKKRKFTLTRKRADWAENREGLLVGEPIKSNESYAERKSKELQRQVTKLQKDINKAVNGLIGAAGVLATTGEAKATFTKLLDDYTKKFNLLSSTFSNDMVSNIDKQVARDLGRSLKDLSGGLTIKTDSVSKVTRNIISASVDQSTTLIRSIPQGYITEVREIIMRTFGSPSGDFQNTVKEIDKLLDTRYKKYKNKAKNLVLDQTRKAYAGISDQRMREAGVTKYRWKHAGGSVNPRPYHKNVLDGKVFSLDDPPIINPSTGERGHPGDAINCKCYKIPVIELGQ